MLYTVAEISEELGFSKVTIYNKLNSLKSELKPYIRHKKGVIHIDDKGLLIIKESLGLNEVKTDLKEDNTLNQSSIVKNKDLNQFKDIDILIETVKKTVESGQENYINSLLEQIELLKSELQKKDDQINNTLRLLENSQVLLKQEKEKVLMLESVEQKEKRSIFDFFKKKHRG